MGDAEPSSPLSALYIIDRKCLLPRRRSPPHLISDVSTRDAYATGDMDVPTSLLNTPQEPADTVGLCGQIWNYSYILSSDACLLRPEDSPQLGDVVVGESRPSILEPSRAAVGLFTSWHACIVCCVVFRAPRVRFGPGSCRNTAMRA